MGAEAAYVHSHLKDLPKNLKVKIKQRKISSYKPYLSKHAMHSDDSGEAAVSIVKNIMLPTDKKEWKEIKTLPQFRKHKMKEEKSDFYMEDLARMGITTKNRIGSEKANHLAKK